MSFLDWPASDALAALFAPPLIGAVLGLLGSACVAVLWGVLAFLVVDMPRPTLAPLGWLAAGLALAVAVGCWCVAFGD